MTLRAFNQSKYKSSILVFVKVPRDVPDDEGFWKVVEEQIEPDRLIIEAYHHERGFCRFIYADWVPAGDDDTYQEEE